MENMLDLTLKSPSYSMVPTSLVNPDIVLPHHEFQKRRGLPELPPGHGPEQREYTMDVARGLVDLDWSQRTPIFHLDDIDWDPHFNQYPYPDDDLDYDDEEEMETDYQNAPPGGTGDAHVATPASAGRRCYRPSATYSMQMSQGQTSGSPRSTHTDTDTAMEMGGLSMAPWEDVITRMPWMSKRLHGMTTGQEQTVRRQALPMPGESLELEVLSEKLYTEYSKKMPSAGRRKSPLGRAGTLRLHLKKTEKGWTQASQSGTGPGVGNPNQYPKEVSSQSKQGKLNQPSCSPLTNKLLDPGEELLGELDYEDMEEINPEPDPEIAQAIAHIPKADVCGDVEMQDVWPPPGFKPEVVKAGYDVNLVRSDQPEQGSSSPVMAGEDRMLDVEESQPRAPGNGRPGHNPDQAADN